jgi:hypothetical protein
MMTEFAKNVKVRCPVCGNDDWWKFVLADGKHVCLCCKGKKREADRVRDLIKKGKEKT